MQSPFSTRDIVKNVVGLIKFFRDARDEPNLTLAGESSIVLLRGFLESSSYRGRTVPGVVTTSLSTWSEALGVPRSLENPLAFAPSHVESDQTPKHTPPTKLDTIKMLEELDANVETPPFKRAFAAGALPMKYTSLRFPDVQRLRRFEANNDSIHGALLQSKTKKPHGLPWPWGRPRMGVDGPTERVNPRLEFRAAHAMQNGSPPSPNFPHLNRRLALECGEPSPYSPTRRKLALVCVGLGDPDGGTYTLHSPYNIPAERIGANDLRRART